MKGPSPNRPAYLAPLFENLLLTEPLFMSLIEVTFKDLPLI